jgi:hypothetical protein
MVLQWLPRPFDREARTSAKIPADSRSLASVYLLPVHPWSGFAVLRSSAQTICREGVSHGEGVATVICEAAVTIPFCVDLHFTNVPRFHQFVLLRLSKLVMGLSAPIVLASRM